MGYTMCQIDSCFNSIVEAYENMSFKKVPCSSISYYGSTYRSIDLSNGNVTVSISLVKHNQTLPGFDYPVQTLTISTDKYIDSNKVIAENCKHFYFIDSNYFVDSLLEVKSARDTSLKRFLNNYNRASYKTIQIDLKKVSDRLLSYLKKAINSLVDSCSYEIRDMYFNYSEMTPKHKLVIVIKRSDKTHTEALYFNPQLLPVYISGQLV